MTARVRVSGRPARRRGDGLLPLFAALALSLAGCASGAPGPGPDRAPADGRADAADAACATLLSTTDEHGYLESGRHAWADDRELGGFPALAGHVAAVRQEASDCPVFVLSAGDMMQGTAVSNLTRGEAAIAAMNAVGYDAAALGNHEFDWGLDTLAERMAQADFPMLAANVYVEGTDRHPDWARPWTVVDRDGVRLGIVGAVTLSTPVTTRPSNVDGLVFRSIAAAMDRYVPAVRAEGVDFVVAVIHAGGRCEEAGGCRGEVVDELRDASRPPDYVVAGHVHGRMETRIQGTPVVLSPSFTSAYGLGRLERRPDGVVERRLLGVRPVTLDVEADTAVARVVESYLATMDRRLERQVAELARPLPKTGQNREFGLGRLIADAQREAAGAQVAIMNNGGIRKGLPAGPVTYGDLFEVQPFQNRVVRLELSGVDLLKALEHAVTPEGVTAHVSGVTVRYDATAPAGARVRSAVLDDGGEVRPGETYAVAVNDFMAEGGDGFEMLTEAREVQDTGIVDLNALVERLRSLPQPVETPADPRWISAAGVERGGEAGLDGGVPDLVGDVALAFPAGAGVQGPGIGAPAPVLPPEGGHGIVRQLGRLPPGVQAAAAAGVAEDRPVTPPLHGPPLLVDEPVVAAAEEDRVLEARLPAVRPVRDVVGVGEAEPAAGEPAPPVPDLQGAPEGGRDGAGAAADVEHLAPGPAPDADEPHVAGEPSRRFS